MERRDVLMLRSEHPGWHAIAAAVVAHDDLALVGDTDSPADVLRIACRQRPHAILAPHEASGEPPLEVLVRLREASPTSRLLVIGSWFEPGELMRLGALRPAAYLLWSEVLESEETLRTLLRSAIGCRVAIRATQQLAFQPRQPAQAGPTTRWTTHGMTSGTPRT